MRKTILMNEIYQIKHNENIYHKLDILFDLSSELEYDKLLTEKLGDLLYEIQDLIYKDLTKILRINHNLMKQIIN